MPGLCSDPDLCIAEICCVKRLDDSQLAQRPWRKFSAVGWAVKSQAINRAAQD
jgi:hypothetical protein